MPLLSPPAREYALLTVHDDYTVSIGRDVVGEWRGGWLWLTSPHMPTAPGMGISPDSECVHSSRGLRAQQLPIVERLLADPTQRLPMFG